MLPGEVPRAKADLASRVDKVRQALREKDEQVNLGASRVTLKGQGHPPDRGDQGDPVADRQHRSSDTP